MVKYVKEIDECKENLLIINKSDFLSERQRLAWLRYFKNRNVNVVFWSAAISIQEEEESRKINAENNSSNEESEKDDESEYTETETETEEDGVIVPRILNKFNFLIDENNEEYSDNNDDEICRNKLTDSNAIPIADEKKENIKVNFNYNNREVKNEIDLLQIEKLKLGDKINESYSLSKEVSDIEIENCQILNRTEIINLFKRMRTDYNKTKPFTIGFVGYPNVGKSSTLNALLKDKKVSVSETPGKTKHYQTFLLDENLIICDCPGLVFPSFVSTRGELIINGILPIDQMRDYNEPINLVIRDIPKNVIEMIYGIEIKISNESEKKNRLPSAEEVCSAYSSIIFIN